MSARAMWKGVIRFADFSVPVKLYGAVEDRGVRFRLLHDKDSQPVSQEMIHSVTGETVESDATRRGYVTAGGDVVVLSAKDLESIQPKESRVIRVLRFLPVGVIDHRWYSRPYFLGADGSAADFAALAKALASTGQEGLVRWVMRKKEYAGALRLHDGRPVLVTLRSSEEVPSLDSLDVPEGPALDERELSMARQLVQALEADFVPLDYRDEYRESVLKLIDSKSRGRHLKLRRPRPKAPSLDLVAALKKSLERERKGA